MQQRFVVCYGTNVPPKALVVPSGWSQAKLAETIKELQFKFARVVVCAPVRGTGLDPFEVCVDLIDEVRLLTHQEPDLSVKLGNVFWDADDNDIGSDKALDLVENVDEGESIIVDCAVRLPLFRLNKDGSTEPLPSGDNR